MITLQPGQSKTLTKRLQLDILPTKADIVLAIDTTGSMCTLVDDAKAQATAIVNAVQAEIDDARFAVVDFRDYPFLPYGTSDIWPYKRLSGFQSAPADVQDAIDAVSDCGGGGDGPESYNRVFYEAVNDPAWTTPTVRPGSCSSSATTSPTTPTRPHRSVTAPTPRIPTRARTTPPTPPTTSAPRLPSTPSRPRGRP